MLLGPRLSKSLFLKQRTIRRRCKHRTGTITTFVLSCITILLLNPSMFQGQGANHLLIRATSSLKHNPVSQQPLMRIKVLLNSIEPISTHSSDHQARLRSLLQSLNRADYGSDIVSLEFVLSANGNNVWLNEQFEIIRNVKWKHGALEVHRITGSCRFMCISMDIASSLDPPSSMVALVDGFHAEPVHKDRYNNIQCMRNRYQNHPFILAYSPSTPKYFGARDKSDSFTMNVFLWAGVERGSLIVPADSAQWHTYVKWVERSRGDWYLWPTVVEPRFRRDARWETFNSTEFGSWSAWLTRFSVLYKVYTMYPSSQSVCQLPMRKIISSSNSHTKLKQRLLRYDLDGNSSEGFESSLILESSIKEIVEFSYNHKGIVSLTVVNEPYLMIARSWICNVDVRSYKPPGLLWVTTDLTSYEAMKKIPNSYSIYLKEAKGGRNGPKFGTPGYWLLMLERSFLIRDLLNNGLQVFLFETDQVWLRDPLPFINSILESDDEIDLVATMDAEHDIAGNFLYFKPSLPMRKVYNELCKQFKENYDGKHIATSNADHKFMIPNDQTLLSKLILYDLEFRSKFPVVLRLLDRELFVCGQWYKNASAYKTNRSLSPVMINNNWITGITEKITRLKHHGHWFLGLDETCSKAQVLSAIRRNDELGVRNNLQLHSVSRDVSTNISAIAQAIHIEY